MLHGLHWVRNAIDFPLRQLIRLRRPGCRLPYEPKARLFPAEALPEAERLVRTYHLARWEESSGRTDFAASLFYAQMLERALREAGVTLPERVTALDAGCGDWFYVQPLYELLRYYGTTRPRTVELDGVELDAYALYEGFHSRYDLALTYAAGCENARYHPIDIRRYTRSADLAFMLFPFLFPDDLRRWGLPKRFLRPTDYLRHVWGLVRPGGWLVIANLGDAERVEQHRLLSGAGLPTVWWGTHTSPLYRYEQPRTLTVLHKEPGPR